MNAWQLVAFERPCLLAEECAHPRYAHRPVGGGSVVLTVNAGYE